MPLPQGNSSIEPDSYTAFPTSKHFIISLALKRSLNSVGDFNPQDAHLRATIQKIDELVQDVEMQVRPSQYYEFRSYSHAIGGSFI